MMLEALWAVIAFILCVGAFLAAVLVICGITIWFAVKGEGEGV